jgi:hypothetical protein
MGTRSRIQCQIRGLWLMTKTTIDIYRSQNGDRWQFIRDDVSGRYIVRHEANQSSGGHRTDLDAEDFLSQDGPWPEYAALRRLLNDAG